MNSTSPTTASGGLYTALSDIVEPRTLQLKGEPGTGKTWKAAHFPNPCFFNFDKNLSGLRKLPKDVLANVKIVDPTVDLGGKRLKGRLVWDNFIKILEKVCEDKSVGTIVIDSMTTLQEFLMDKILNDEAPSKQFQIQDWGTISRYWKYLGEELLCHPTLDKHVIMIAHERKTEVKSASGMSTIKYSLNLGGSTKDSFDLYFSDVWRCYHKISNAKVQFCVATEPAENYTAKRSLELPGKFVWDEQQANILKLIAT